MNTTPIVEDFRFATVAEVNAYAQSDLYEKPHIPGHHFSQLLDQLAGFCNVRNCYKRPLVLTTGGTAVWIANSMNDYDNENELILYLEKEYTNTRTNFLLDNFTNIANRVECSAEISIQDIALADILILACRDGLDYWLQYVAKEPAFKSLQKVVYDPVKAVKKLSCFNGEYFMGSDIWVGT